MKDWKGLFDDVLAVARVAAPLTGPAGPLAIELAEKTAALIDRVRDESPIDLPPELEAIRAELDRQMNANVDAVVDKLRGNT